MIPDVLTFEDAIKASNGGSRAILIGNGFSIAQAGGQFSYRNLLERCGLEAGSPIRNVFRTLETVDFEEVMRALEHAAQIEAAYGDNAKSKQFQEDAALLREALIHAVRKVHPGIKFDIPEIQRTSCAQFLKHFDLIFTLNYDLLLYWIILKTKCHSDGFGRGDKIGGFRTFHRGANCTTFYLHGALHLFLNRQLETQKRVVTNFTIVDDIASTIQHGKQLPLFVAEGSASQKMAKINSVPYLRYCYEKLNQTTGSVFIFGHSVSDNDLHIYDAIFGSAISNLFFCVHRPEKHLKYFREKLARYAARRKDIELVYVDAATANVWGGAG